ncbi:GNAT family N-acetyltransferase [Hyphomicrobium sp.]|uniref:GNAT family N-acetyltransferase n=1 Tax=Hyphomicrobium sp. TaxID=82 RepID=UPI001E08AD57|nr:GNAT family N-acetyltransferase [Hyphomicrobium sp.]MBY0562454.1 GNAT family N-acetyltransferase [Hyphomicrobium sp.]
MKAKITRSSEIVKSARIAQMSALFDVPPTEKSHLEWNVDLPIEDKPWNIGLIVGPSGCGKSTIAKELFGAHIVSGHEWPKDRAILDAFPQGMSIKVITNLLCAVGFGSAPNWLRPFHVLSNGEQFRVTVARAIAESTGVIAIDEFTSVVDRQVAKVASHTVQKTVRKENRQLIAISCHYDIVEWLQPDWVYEPATATFEWRSLRRRPTVDLEIRSCGKDLWPTFKPYHYLSGSIHPGAKCAAAFLNDQPIAFTSCRKVVHPTAHDIMIGHRLVVLPDYQGLGIGGRLDEWLGQFLWDKGWRYHNVVAHPAMIAYYSKSPRWKCERFGGLGNNGPNAAASLAKHQRDFTAQRVSGTFVYWAPKGSNPKPRRPHPLEL